MLLKDKIPEYVISHFLMHSILRQMTMWTIVLNIIKIMQQRPDFAAESWKRKACFFLFHKQQFRAGVKFDNYPEHWVSF